MPKPPGASSEYSEKSVELSVANEPVPVPTPVAPKAVSNKKIKVRALRNGFIHNVRRSPGDEFEVVEKELGDWMLCLDPSEQKKHHARSEDRRKSANRRAAEEDRRELASE